MIKLKNLLTEVRIQESGLRNINALAKEYKEAEIYFHMDLDGVTSAIGMKKYLEKYGIKTVDAHHIQYGGREFAAPKPRSGRLNVMVDFAHGKPMMHIHTDHHSNQSGVERDTSAKFKHDPSNVQTISQEISPSDLFPPEDIKMISMIDSAMYDKYDVTPDEVIRAIFKADRDIDMERNRIKMALACNKILLAFKNKPQFLEKLVMESDASLISLFTTIKKVVKEMNYSIGQVEKDTNIYIGKQKARGASVLKSPHQIQSLSSGEYAMFGKCLVQYGGGDVTKGGYDRYIPFKLNPEAQFIIIGWPMGLVQASKNPFIKKENPKNLNDIANKVLDKYKPYLSKTIVSFYDLKKSNETDIWKGKGSDNSFGYTLRDLFATLKDKIVSMPEDITDIERLGDQLFSKMSFDDKQKLRDIKLTAYDVIKAQSGGHPNITNISGLNILGRDSTSFIKRIMYEMVLEIQKIELQ